MAASNDAASGAGTTVTPLEPLESVGFKITGNLMPRQSSSTERPSFSVGNDTALGQLKPFFAK